MTFYNFCTPWKWVALIMKSIALIWGRPAPLTFSSSLQSAASTALLHCCFPLCSAALLCVLLLFSSILCCCSRPNSTSILNCTLHCTTLNHSLVSLLQPTQSLHRPSTLLTVCCLSAQFYGTRMATSPLLLRDPLCCAQLAQTCSWPVDKAAADTPCFWCTAVSGWYAQSLLLKSWWTVCQIAASQVPQPTCY